MKIFQRSKQDPGDEAEGDAAKAPAVEAPAPREESTGAGSGAVNDEFAESIDRSVKEISEKIVRLTSSVDNVAQEKQDFEEKLLRMEERMRKLTALTEVMSNKFNPFIGDEPPPETQVLPEARLPEALPDTPRRDGRAGTPPAGAIDRNLPPPPAPLDLDHAGPGSAGAHDAAIEEYYDSSFDDEPFMPDLDEEVARPAPAKAAPPAYLEALPQTFASSYILLNWSELLIRRAGREGMGELLQYYQQLGWISTGVLEEVMKYAEGIILEDEDVEELAWCDWRAEVDLHKRSLLFIERLRGTELSPQVLKRLERDVGWITRGIPDASPAGSTAPAKRKPAAKTAATARRRTTTKGRKT